MTKFYPFVYTEIFNSKITWSEKAVPKINYLSSKKKPFTLSKSPIIIDISLSMPHSGIECWSFLYGTISFCLLYCIYLFISRTLRKNAILLDLVFDLFWYVRLMFWTMDGSLWYTDIGTLSKCNVLVLYQSILSNIFLFGPICFI